jgi:hypothetical protein
MPASSPHRRIGGKPVAKAWAAAAAADPNTQQVAAAMKQTSAVSRRRSMRDTVRRDGTEGTYLDRLAVPVREAPVREDEELGALWEVKPSYAHQVKLHAARYAADVIRLRRAKGDHDAAARYAAPLVDVLEARPAPEAEMREGVKDAEEDVLETRYRLNRCPETARPLVLKRMEYLSALMDDTRRIAALEGITL